MSRASRLLLLFGGGVPAIVTDGLVAEYRFDDGSGETLADYGGSGYDLQLGSTSGSDTNDPSWVTAGLSFTTDDYCFRNTTPAVSQPNTIVVCANLELPATAYVFDGSGAPRQIFESHSTDKIGQYAGSFVYSAAGQGYTTGWKIYTFVFSGASSKGYISNTEVISGDPGAGGLGGLTIGCVSAKSSLFITGVVGYFIIYNKALDSDERAQNALALTAIMAGRGITVP